MMFVCPCEKELKEKKMDQKEYLTIKEFADAAGVSKQAVYQRLTGTLKPYVSIKDGVKYLKRSEKLMLINKCSKVDEA